MKIIERFLKYVSIHTTSDPDSSSHPSTERQKDLGNELVKEMNELKMKDVIMTKYGYVYGLIPRNTQKNVPTIGFIAHMDTSSDCSGKNIKVRQIPNYDWNDVILNKNKKIILSTKEFPFLKKEKGKTLIVTDGTTLLGADDKAGITEIMTMAEHLINHPEIEHGDIRIAFTPDEEIGEGTDFFDLDLFPCDFAYTVDGGEEGSIDYENFNAASCDVTINGINIHPGSAKNHMINSLLVGMEFNSLLPIHDIPENTEMYEGFNHLNGMNGNVEKCNMHYIIRNHDKEKFNKQKNDFKRAQEFINNKYHKNTCEIEIKDSYYNMYDIIKDHFEIVEIAIKATKSVGLEPIISPIRGGTDGAQLTYKGLLCPNLGTGGFNFHGPYECITLEGMEKCTKILLEIVNEVMNIK